MSSFAVCAKYLNFALHIEYIAKFIGAKIKYAFHPCTYDLCIHSNLCVYPIVSTQLMTYRQKRMRCQSNTDEGESKAKRRENVAYATQDEDETVFKKPKSKVSTKTAVTQTIEAVS